MEGVKPLDYKIGLLSIKIIPVLMFLVMWIHTGLLSLGINSPVAVTIAGSALFPSVLILSISRMLKFCLLHKSLTVYSLVVDICINYNRYIGFGSILEVLRIICFCIGLIIFICLICNICGYSKRCVNIKDVINYARSYKEASL